MLVDVKLDDGGIKQALAKLQAHGHSPQVLLQAMAEVALTNNKERHEREVGPDGEAWVALKPSTRANKRQDRMLYETGDMLRLHIRASGGRVFVGTNDHKAVFHQFGTDPYTIVPKNAKALASKVAGVFFGKKVNHPGLPARPILGINSRDRREMRDVLIDVLERDATNNGRFNSV